MAIDTIRMQTNKRKSDVARLSIFSNTLLVVTKLIVGAITGSVSIISEALHSGNDLIAAAMAYYSVKKSSEPADRDHHFGHGKFESVSGTVEGLLIFVVAIGIVWTAIGKLTGHQHGVEKIGWGFAVMLLSAIVNMYVSAKLMKVARDTDSVALAADAWHLRTDVYTSAGVLVGLILIAVTGKHIFDPIAAIAVALMILKAAWEITRESVGHLLDVALPSEEQDMIRALVEEHYPRALEAHELRTRRAGSERYVDLHLVVPKDTHVEDAHALCDHLEERIAELFPRTNVLIHLEPGDPPREGEPK